MAGLSVTPIVALDVAGVAEARELVDRLGSSCNFYKVGSELFTASGPGFVGELRSRGLDVFLDLKFHDIPHTVAGAVRSAISAGATMLTVHASGGVAMLRAAAAAASSTAGCRVMGVTVLTSLSGTDLATSWGRSDAVSVEAEVVRLAGDCIRAGLHGVVCSGLEARVVADAFAGILWPLVPGIRFADGAAHDQARIMTPAGAARAGARYVVVGRAVTGAADPVAAMVRVNDEIRGA